MSLIPATILTGFLGAGKTTLLKRVLTEAHGQKIAVIENEFGEENIDNDILSVNTEEQIIQMSNGCVCCTIREDLRSTLSDLAEKRRKGELSFDRVVIETTGLADPGPVAQTFFMDDEVAGSYLLDSILTLVDAKHADTQLDTRQEARRQVGFADQIFISKTDLVDEATLGKVMGVIRTLNTEAKVIPIQNGAVPLTEVMGTGLFDMEKAQRSPGWIKELMGEHVPETEEYGISSFVYKARRPFHPQRFWEVINQQWPGVIRSKGFFWLATRMAWIGEWHQAGAACRYGHAGTWWCTAPKEYWPDDEESRLRIHGNMQEPYGDRRQEIVLIGIGMDKVGLTEMLDRALLTEAEYAEGPESWAKLPDPFASADELALVD